MEIRCLATYGMAPSLRRPRVRTEINAMETVHFTQIEVIHIMKRDLDALEDLSPDPALSLQRHGMLRII